MAFQGDEVFYPNHSYGMGDKDGLNLNDYTRRFISFLKDWNVNKEFVYRDQLMQNAGLENYFVRVNLSDVEIYERQLAMEIRRRPFAMLPLFEKAARDLFLSLNIGQNENDVPEFQVQIYSGETAKRLRQVRSEDIGQLVQVQGIVVNAGRVLIRGRKVALRCRRCGHSKTVMMEHGMGSLPMPGFCERASGTGQSERCPPRSYMVDSDHSEFIDFQTLKLQEASDSIPTGEIPRTYQIACERYLVDHLVPGMRLSLTGVYAVTERRTIRSTANVSGPKLPYIYVLGFEAETMSGRGFTPFFTPAEEAHFASMAKDPHAFEKICKTVAPSIFGHEDVKQAVACLMLSGSSKLLPDKTRLRGDINVLLMGDPSTAKSQILKFVHRAFPICVYTSGKGSSAAGLTAAIVRDASSREFQLEGGALVLADGGIVCIDEFDKMRSQDRVAIHEAMEQQTISVAKAGITTILNSRTAVLAAANPVFGSFSSMKAVADQIDLQTTILSRFDCIFLVLDQRLPEQDARVAQHILNLHLRDNSTRDEASEIDLTWLRRFLMYARLKVSPRLTEEAALMLENNYVGQRSQVKLHESKTAHIPLTVRQLEAIIRISEAVAKARLSSVVTKEDAEQAIRIFENSTMKTIKNNKLQFMFPNDPDFMETVHTIEDFIRHKLPIGAKTTFQALMEDLEGRFQNANAVTAAIETLVRREELYNNLKGDFLIRKK